MRLTTSRGLDTLTVDDTDVLPISPFWSLAPMSQNATNHTRYLETATLVVAAELSGRRSLRSGLEFALEFV